MCLFSGISGASSCTPQPQISEALLKNISRASSQVKDLKSEFKQLRRIHEAQSESIQDSIRDAMTKIQVMMRSLTVHGQINLYILTQRLYHTREELKINNILSAQI